MRLPRDVSGRDLAKALGKLGYEITRQTSSHVRLTTQRSGEHHVTIPDHDPIRVGTLAGIFADVARHHNLTRDRLTRLLFGRKQPTKPADIDRTQALLQPSMCSCRDAFCRVCHERAWKLDPPAAA